MKKLFLVDVSSMFFRAYYAIPPLNTKSGLPTNALYGFLSMTVKLLREKPDYIGFCFDRKEPSFRFDLYNEYKANRGEMPDDLQPQVPYIRELSQRLGIACFDKKGFEADDIIGTLVQLGKSHKVDTVIVSGDKDFAQLVGPKVSMFDTMRDKRYDVQGVIDKWGVSPEQMIDYLAIVGDSSDNIPGVKGVGPKGAQKLLAEYKTLDGIYKNIDQVKGPSVQKKLKENKKEAELAKKLVTIETNVDMGVTLEDLKPKEIDREHLTELLEELEFLSFTKNLFGTKSSSSKPESKPKKKKAKSSVSVGESGLSSAKKEEKWSLNQLAEKVEPYSDIWAHLDERSLYIVYDKSLVQVEASLEEVGRVLSEKSLSWSGFDVKSIWRQLKLKQPVTPAWDSMLAGYVVRPGNIDSFEKLFNQYTGKTTPDLAGGTDIYKCHQELKKILKKKLKEFRGEQILKEIELPLVPVLHDMEQVGMFVDVKELGKQSQSLEKDISRLEKLVHKEAGESFNVASPKQLGHILFEKLGLPSSKKTKTGFSTSSDVLSKLVNEYPICGHVLEFRELSKLKSTYVDALPELIDSETGKLHTHLRQAVTTTGRLSCNNPNLQNIPIRTQRGRDIRKAFVAQKGYQLLSADYSQIELRVLAHITEDEGLCRAFQSDRDVHAATAAEVFDVDLADVTPDLRRKAKAVNFGIAYGQGVYGLSESLGIPRGEAKEIIERYFNRFKKVKAYMEDIVDLAKKQGYVETMFGRRRYIDELSARNKAVQKFGERAAINAPMQGSASDIVKKAMIDIYESVPTPMLLQVHDELLFECATDEAEELATEVRELMEDAVQMSVPLVVNTAYGNNWDEAH
jgi:DNA polymerase-1